MKLHLECERTIHFQKVDGTQGVLKEGAQAYMHFITSKKIDIWMRATVLELHDEGLRVQSDDGLRWNFFYSDLKDVSTQKPDAVTRAEVERLINFLRPVPHTSLPDCFVQAVALLTRPYHRLTEQQAAVIRKMAMENDCDVLEDCCTGQQYTFIPIGYRFILSAITGCCLWKSLRAMLKKPSRFLQTGTKIGAMEALVKYVMCAARNICLKV